MKTRARSDSIEMGKRARPSLGEASRLRGAPERRFVAAAASAAWVGRSRTCSCRRLLRVGTRGNSSLRSAKGSARGRAERQPWRLRSPLVSPESFQPLKAAFISLTCAAAIAQMVLLGPSAAVGATFSLVDSFDETEGYGGQLVTFPTVFKMSPDGNLTTLAVSDGSFSRFGGPLIQGRDGNLYGTTYGGGAGGLGTVFKMTLAGTLTTVVSFSDTIPPSSLMRASDGNFYGTMSGGGRYTCVTLNFGQFCDYFGTIFKLSPDGTMTNLVLFNV